MKYIRLHFTRRVRIGLLRSCNSVHEREILVCFVERQDWDVASLFFSFAYLVFDNETLCPLYHVYILQNALKVKSRSLLIFIRIKATVRQLKNTLDY